MKTALDEEVAVGDICLVAHGSSAQYAKIIKLHRTRADVAFLAPPDGASWGDAVTVPEGDLLFKLPRAEADKMGYPK